MQNKTDSELERIANDNAFYKEDVRFLALIELEKRNRLSPELATKKSNYELSRKGHSHENENKSSKTNSKTNILVKKYAATRIGLIYSLACIAAAYTMIIPIIFIYPLSSFLENHFKTRNEGAEFQIIGESTLITLVIISIITILLFYYITHYKLKYEKQITKMHIHLGFIILLFILQPLGLYIYTSSDWNMASDGQYIMVTILTFPITGIIYILLGYFVDIMRLKIK